MRLKTSVIAVLASLTLAAPAAAATAPPLTAASGFAILAGTAISNTGPTVVTGDIGVQPGSSVTGFPPGTVIGATHAGDAIAAQAQADLAAAYANAAGQPTTATIATQLGGQTLLPGVYDSGTGTFDITGNLILDAQGNPNAVFIFKMASTLVTAANNSQVSLANGAQACNVFWQVGSSATLGANTLFRGNIFALTSITATTGAAVDGRLLARNGAVTLDTNRVTRSPCAAIPPIPPVPPVVKVTRPPKHCTSRDFQLRITTGNLAVGTTDVFLDGRLIKRSRQSSFTVTVRAKKLDGGRHKIRVVTTDSAGNTTVRKSSFRRCGTPSLGNFTG